MNEQEIYLEAMTWPDPAERCRFLDEACGGDTDLRKRLDRLFGRADQVGSFLEHSPVAAATLPRISAAPGTQIGPYKIREQIGEGGMGEVYVAEQTEPVRRKVALKIIRPGMATRDVIARFEAERQALAMMEHPNIARIFDAGVRQPFQADERPEGYDSIKRGTRQAGKPDVHFSQPYFVMELVQGPPTTDYCDDRRLTTRERLELFLFVCRAVQHAHQKGIIHRDLKPSNVLVPEIDGVPVPKVIDFGVAKAIGQKLTEKTVYTQFSQMIGTPTYMSPEQAGLGVVDIDTRSDIYSLGVLLYELLTGTTPFDSETLKRASFDEMQRIIREEDPPPPSKRLTQRTKCNDTHTTQSASRPPQSGFPPHSALRTPHSAFDQDLDWIVLKCLEKDRTRRYETAADLARDIERHLADEPVHARPPSTAYRAKKFLRKHRTGVLAATAVVLALTLGVVFTSLALARAVSQRDRARENLNRGCELIEYALGPTYQALSIPADSERREYRDRLLEYSIRFFESLGEEERSEPRMRSGLARAYGALAFNRLLDGKDVEMPARRAIDLLTPLTDVHPQNVDYRVQLASIYGDLGTFHWAAGRRRLSAVERGKAAQIMRRAIAERPSHARAHGQLVRACSLFGNSLHELGRFREADAQFLSAIEVAETLRNSDPEDGRPINMFPELVIHARYAELLIDMGRYQVAAGHLDAARRIAQEEASLARNEGKRILYNFWAASVESNIGQLNIINGNPDLALSRLRTASELLDDQLGQPSGGVWPAYVQGHTHSHSAFALTQLGRFEEAIAAHEQAQLHWRSTGIQIAVEYAARSQACIGELNYALGRAGEGDVHLAAALRDLNATAAALPDEPYTIEPLVVFLCMCPNPAMRDPERAVHLAEQFTSDCDSSGPFWRYLALARYRTGDCPGAEDAIQRCMKLRRGGDALDWLLLAASQHQAGHRDEARESFAHAQELISRGAPVFYGHIGMIGFQRIRAEVETVGLTLMN